MDTFAVLGDHTRRNIVELLAKNGTLSASDISDKFSVTPSAISQHLKVLREAKLVDMEKKAQQRLYQINPASIDEIEDWIKKIKQNWNERFDRLEMVLKQQKRGGE